VWYGVKEVVQEGNVDLVCDVVLVGDMIAEGHNQWRWTNGAVGSDCCVG